MKREIDDANRCAGFREDGQRCANPARRGTLYCFRHDPDGPPEERRCTGIATGGTTRPERKGERCMQWALPGLTVCRFHGGSQKAAAVGRQRVAEANLLAKAQDLVGEPVDNPLAELANLAGRARAWMELLERKVDDLGDGIRYEGKVGEQLRAEVALYERAMDRLGKFLADFGRLNIDERLSKIEEAKADVILRAIDAALAYAGVTGPKATEAKKVAARHLRAA